MIKNEDLVVGEVYVHEYPDGDVNVMKYGGDGRYSICVRYCGDITVDVSVNSSYPATRIAKDLEVDIVDEAIRKVRHILSPPHKVNESVAADGLADGDLTAKIWELSEELDELKASIQEYYNPHKVSHCSGIELKLKFPPTPSNQPSHQVKVDYEPRGVTIDGKKYDIVPHEVEEDPAPESLEERYKRELLGKKFKYRKERTVFTFSLRACGLPKVTWCDGDKYYEYTFEDVFRLINDGSWVLLD